MTIMLPELQLKRWLFTFFIMLGLFLFSFSLFAEQKDVTVTVETTVDPYLTLILESTAYQISPNGDEISSKQIPPGSLYFGDRVEGSALESSKSEHPFSTPYKTVVKVSVIDNSKPFVLKILFVPTENQKSLLELKTQDGKDCALQVKTSATSETKFPKYIEALNVWTPFPLTGEMFLYDTQNEVSSDQFAVTFALRNLYSNTLAAPYGGKVMWILSSTM
jgi:hypothetical protein